MATLLPGSLSPASCVGPCGPARWRRPRSASWPSCSRDPSPPPWSLSPTSASSASCSPPADAAGRSPPAAASAVPTHRPRPSTWSSTSRWPSRRRPSPRGHRATAPGLTAGAPARGRVPVALRQRGRALAHPRCRPLRVGGAHGGSADLPPAVAREPLHRAGGPHGLRARGAPLPAQPDQPVRFRRQRRRRRLGPRPGVRPGTAYGAICECGNAGCGCGSTCCSGFSEFCCAVSGANFCPADTVMGGWWVADNSSYCGGPRYYMDCNSTCGD